LRFYVWTRDLHLYIGLFLSPFVLVFAISTLFLNHAWKPWETTQAQTMSAQIQVPAGLERLALARQVLAQLGVSGEIEFIRYLPKENRLILPVTKPGSRVSIDVELGTGRATVERRDTGIWDALVYMHRSPGPHNVALRGNWFYMRLWRWFADATVYLVLFLSVSGVYLWAVLKAERRIGLLLLGAGVASFLMVIYALTV
jgi:hypothetical protein